MLSCLCGKGGEPETQPYTGSGTRNARHRTAQTTESAKLQKARNPIQRETPDGADAGKRETPYGGQLPAEGPEVGSHLRAPSGVCAVRRPRCLASAPFGVCALWRLRPLASAPLGVCAVRRLRPLPAPPRMTHREYHQIHNAACCARGVINPPLGPRPWALGPKPSALRPRPSVFDFYVPHHAERRVRIALEVIFALGEGDLHVVGLTREL